MNSKATKSTSQVPSKTIHTAPSTASTEAIIMPPANLAKAPSVPQGFQALTPEERRKVLHLTQEQVSGIPGLSQELSASTSWTEDFGQYAPSASMLIQMLNGIGSLAAEATNAAAWSVYVTDELGLCATSALEQFDTVSSLLEGALKVNPGLATTYPQLITFLAAKSRIAKKGAATRKQNKKSKAKAAAGVAGTIAAGAAGSTVVASGTVGH